jgi:hypothetical protein
MSWSVLRVRPSINEEASVCFFTGSCTHPTDLAILLQAHSRGYVHTHAALNPTSLAATRGGRTHAAGSRNL